MLKSDGYMRWSGASLIAADELKQSCAVSSRTRILVVFTKEHLQPIFNPLCGLPCVLFRTFEYRWIPVSTSKCWVFRLCKTSIRGFNSRPVLHNSITCNILQSSANPDNLRFLAQLLRQGGIDNIHKPDGLYQLEPAAQGGNIGENHSWARRSLRPALSVQEQCFDHLPAVRIADRFHRCAPGALNSACISAMNGVVSPPPL
jgi:hypothetical protein